METKNLSDRQIKYRRDKAYRNKCIDRSRRNYRLFPRKQVLSDYDKERYSIMKNVKELSEYLKNVQELVFE